MTTQNLTYKFTLDTFKNGIQRVVQGLQTGEHVARKMEITLVSAGDTYEIPFNGVVANMYVKRPSQTSPSINPCSFDATRNKILYTIHDSDISEAGLVEMQLKLIDVRDGNDRILVAPKFNLEVWESFTEDSSAETTPEFSTLIDALAYIEAAKGHMISEIYIDNGGTFVVEYVDGTEYTTDALSDILALAQATSANALKSEGYALGKQEGIDVESGTYFHNNAKYFAEQASGDAQSASSSASTASSHASLAQSYAKGGTGGRVGEDSDNAKYYMERCMEIAGGLEGGGLLPMGTVTFENLPTENLFTGAMYNISNAFTTDSRFKDGGGKEHGAGANVYWTADGKWDVQEGEEQTVNGKTGNSIILDGSDLKLTGYSKPNATAELESTDTINQALGKLEKGLDNKVASVSGKGLSANDYTNADKQAVGYLNGFKFGGIMTEAEFEAGQPYNDDVIRFTYKPTT